jgi:hypothetical protein
MELVAMELKHAGCYIARTLSYEVGWGFLESVGVCFLDAVGWAGSAPFCQQFHINRTHPSIQPTTKQNVVFEQVQVTVSAEFRRTYDQAAQLWQDVGAAMREVGAGGGRMAHICRLLEPALHL